jgi:hypothetical protein
MSQAQNPLQAAVQSWSNSAIQAAKASVRDGEFVDISDRDATLGMAIGYLQNAQGEFDRLDQSLATGCGSDRADRDSGQDVALLGAALDHLAAATAAVAVACRTISTSTFVPKVQS